MAGPEVLDLAIGVRVPVPKPSLDSSVAELFRGKEVVVGSTPTRGSNAPAGGEIPGLQTNRHIAQWPSGKAAAC